MRNLILFLLFQTTLHAQTSLFFPRNYQPAYEKGTRSHDGKPGPNYWQNRADYRIKASLDPKTRRLSGEETIRYVNNSPDTLKRIRVKLAHDRYRKGSLRAYDVAPSDVTDEGVRIESVQYGALQIAAEKLRRESTFLDILLEKNVLPPHSTANLAIKWSYTLPADENAAREYAADSTVFFVPYWYPQIAVYDDLNGWASAPYNGTQEFYHEFGDYDVTLSMPRGFQVWATGVWQNPEQILEAPFLERWKKAQTSDEVIPVFTAKDLAAGGLFKAGKNHEFHFKAENVPDFAFAASNRYLWDAVSVVVDPSTGRRTFIGAAYDPKSSDYPEVAGITAKGIGLMSSWLPGYPFPYPCMTVFNGNDGMEYPMMCNDASTAPRSPMSLTIHEVSHTYFPFMMGINEQDHAWMDEGWAAFFDYLLTDSLSNHTLGGVRNYSEVAGTENDVPPMVRSRNLTTAYRNAAYQRPQNAYFTLLDLLGYEQFHHCMKGYIEEWNGKHPAPFDFFNTWNRLSGQNLDWFWKAWFFEWGFPDLGIAGIVKDEASNRQKVMIKRKGNIPVPIHLTAVYDDGTREILHTKASVWKDGKLQHFVDLAPGKSVQGLVLGQKTIPDSDQKDNIWKR